LAVAELVFERTWRIRNYWSGQQISMLLRSSELERPIHVTMLIVSMPFAWAGIALTIRRLRAANCPPWLAVLFFVPVLNLLFFVMLCLIPNHEARPPSTESERQRPVDQQAAAPKASAPQSNLGTVVFVATIGTMMAVFDIFFLGLYGTGLFAGLPFCLGLVASVLHDRAGRRSRRAYIATALTSVGLVAGFLFVLSLEGIICLLMAAPIWLACAALGGCVGFTIQERRTLTPPSAGMMLLILLAVPVLMGAEKLASVQPVLYSVQTEVVVKAPPEKVWRQVVSFPEIPPPKEWIFRTGIAYPTSAKITGSGVGAIRECRFSTGTFVEPIEVWDEPNVLRFSVTQNPPPMRELSFHGVVHAPHLHGFLESRAGQFELTLDGNGGTILRGTTWYSHNMQPGFYWRIWSDWMIHAIHLRVLKHIKMICEEAVVTQGGELPLREETMSRDELDRMHADNLPDQ